MQGLKSEWNNFLYCEKGPISEPASSFLFMLDRRGVREQDGPCDRGVKEIIRLFTEWILEKAGSTHEKGHSFVLAHPDFAVQNFFVDDDGTLCGIIDWDGVAAVPVPVGCLRYPDWLMSDWHPRYNYWAGLPEQDVNSPEELAAYRIMYAQFVEASSSMNSNSGKAGKATADITRMSLVANSLDTGAHDLKLTGGMVGIIFEKLAVFTSLSDDGDISDSDSDSESESDAESIADDVQESSRDDSNGDISNGEFSSGDDSNEDTTPTEAEETIPNSEGENGDGCSSSKVVSELSPDQSLVKDIDEPTDLTRLRRVDATSSGSPALQQEQHLISCPSCK